MRIPHSRLIKVFRRSDSSYDAEYWLRRYDSDKKFQAKFIQMCLSIIQPTCDAMLSSNLDQAADSSIQISPEEAKHLQKTTPKEPPRRLFTSSFGTGLRGGGSKRKRTALNDEDELIQESGDDGDDDDDDDEYEVEFHDDDSNWEGMEDDDDDVQKMADASVFASFKASKNPIDPISLDEPDESNIQHTAITFDATPNDDVEDLAEELVPEEPSSPTVKRPFDPPSDLEMSQFLKHSSAAAMSPEIVTWLKSTLEQLKNERDDLAAVQDENQKLFQEIAQSLIKAKRELMQAMEAIDHAHAKAAEGQNRGERAPQILCDTPDCDCRCLLKPDAVQTLFNMNHFEARKFFDHHKVLFTMAVYEDATDPQKVTDLKPTRDLPCSKCMHLWVCPRSLLPRNHPNLCRNQKKFFDAEGNCPSCSRPPPQQANALHHPQQQQALAQQHRPQDYAVALIPWTGHKKFKMNSSSNNNAPLPPPAPPAPPAIENNQPPAPSLRNFMNQHQNQANQPQPQQQPQQQVERRDDLNHFIDCRVLQHMTPIGPLDPLLGRRHFSKPTVKSVRVTAREGKSLVDKADAEVKQVEVKNRGEAEKERNDQQTEAENTHTGYWRKRSAQEQVAAANAIRDCRGLLMILLSLSYKNKSTSSPFIDACAACRKKDAGPEFITNVRKNILACVYAHVYDIDRLKNNMKFKKAVVDETYIGKRKYNRGHLTRIQAYWILTITEVVADERDPRKNVCNRVIAYLVPNRERETLAQKIRDHLDPEGCELFTDSAKFYRGPRDANNDTGFIRALRDAGFPPNAPIRHYSVNHKNHFKAWALDENDNWIVVHTNHAESVNAALKATWKATFGGVFGTSSEQVQLRLALSVLFFKTSTALERFRLLLMCIQTYKGAEFSATPDQTLIPITVQEIGKRAYFDGSMFKDWRKPDGSLNRDANNSLNFVIGENNINNNNIIVDILPRNLNAVSENLDCYRRFLANANIKAMVLYDFRNHREVRKKCYHLFSGIGRVDAQPVQQDGAENNNNKKKKAAQYPRERCCARSFAVDKDDSIFPYIMLMVVKEKWNGVDTGIRLPLNTQLATKPPPKAAPKSAALVAQAAATAAKAAREQKAANAGSGRGRPRKFDAPKIPNDVIQDATRDVIDTGEVSNEDDDDFIAAAECENDKNRNPDQRVAFHVESDPRIPINRKLRPKQEATARPKSANNNNNNNKKISIRPSASKTSASFATTEDMQHAPPNPHDYGDSDQERARYQRDAGAYFNAVKQHRQGKKPSPVKSSASRQQAAVQQDGSVSISNNNNNNNKNTSKNRQRVEEEDDDVLILPKPSNSAPAKPAAKATTTSTSTTAKPSAKATATSTTAKPSAKATATSTSAKPSAKATGITTTTKAKGKQQHRHEVIDVDEVQDDWLDQLRVQDEAAVAEAKKTAKDDLRTRERQQRNSGLYGGDAALSTAEDDEPQWPMYIRLIGPWSKEEMEELHHYAHLCQEWSDRQEQKRQQMVANQRRAAQAENARRVKFWTLVADRATEKLQQLNDCKAAAETVPTTFSFKVHGTFRGNRSRVRKVRDHDDGSEEAFEGSKAIETTTWTSSIPLINLVTLVFKHKIGPLLFEPHADSGRKLWIGSLVEGWSNLLFCYRESYWTNQQVLHLFGNQFIKLLHNFKVEYTKQEQKIFNESYYYSDLLQRKTDPKIMKVFNTLPNRASMCYANSGLHLLLDVPINSELATELSKPDHFTKFKIGQPERCNFMELFGIFYQISRRGVDDNDEFNISATTKTSSSTVAKEFWTHLFHHINKRKILFKNNDGYPSYGYYYDAGSFIGRILEMSSELLPGQTNENFTPLLSYTFSFPVQGYEVNKNTRQQPKPSREQFENQITVKPLLPGRPSFVAQILKKFTPTMINLNGTAGTVSVETSELRSHFIVTVFRAFGCKFNEELVYSEAPLCQFQQLLHHNNKVHENVPKRQFVLVDTPDMSAIGDALPLPRNSPPNTPIKRAIPHVLCLGTLAYGSKIPTDIRTFLLGTVVCQMEERETSCGGVNYQVIPTHSYMHDFAAQSVVDIEKTMNTVKQNAISLVQRELKDCNSGSDVVTLLRLGDDSKLNNKNNKEEMKDLDNKIKMMREGLIKIIEYQSTTMKSDLLQFICQLPIIKSFFEFRFDEDEGKRMTGGASSITAHFIPYSRLDLMPARILRKLVEEKVITEEEISEWYVEFDDCAFYSKDNRKNSANRVRLVHYLGVMQYASTRGCLFRYDEVQSMRIAASDREMKIVEEVDIVCTYPTHDTSLTQELKSAGVRDIVNNNFVKGLLKKQVRLDLNQVVELRDKQKKSKPDQSVTSSHWHKASMEVLRRKDEAEELDDDAAPQPKGKKTTAKK